MINFSARRLVLATVGGAAVLVGALAVSVPAAAAPVTTVCSSSHFVRGDVPGDLLVPADNYCEVSHATVHGSIDVEGGATMQMASSLVDGGLHAAMFADVTVTGQSTVSDVVLDQTAQFDAYQSTIDGDVTGTMNAPTGEEENETDLAFSGSTVTGNVSVSLGALYRYAVIDTSTFSGNVTITGATLRFTSSTVAGRATLADARTDLGLYEGHGDPSNVCGVAFAGNLTLRDSPGAVQLGGGFGCAGVQPITVRGALLVLDNTGRVHISAHIGGDLVCRRNTHHPIDGHPTSAHLHTTVGGHALGQCATLAAS